MKKKILHINLGGPYNHDMGYQGALLPIENHKEGHEVTVISGCLKWHKGKIIEVEESDTVINGIRYIRLKYTKIINSYLTEKLRLTSKLSYYLNEISPEIILQHDIQSLDIYKLKKYKLANPSVIIYADSHSDGNNSAQNILSKFVLHKVIYKKIIKDNIGIFEKILCISHETMEFLNKMYDIPTSILEFYPLGGTPINRKEKKEHRREIREELKISDEEIVFCHSGKIENKKKTLELLESFRKIPNPNCRLIIIGSINENLESNFFKSITLDKRVLYLGWKQTSDLYKYIAASDLYVQPGSQSATMQNALCLGTPVLFENNLSHRAYMKGNAIAINSFEELESELLRVSNNPGLLKEMSKKSFEIAEQELDYSVLAKRITL